VSIQKFEFDLSDSEITRRDFFASVWRMAAPRIIYAVLNIKSFSDTPVNCSIEWQIAEAPKRLIMHCRSSSDFNFNRTLACLGATV
jgi:hypothetical protein